MATKTKVEEVKPIDTQAEQQLLLETKKVKALEKIANSLDALTVWFEEIDKDEWSQRIQWYLTEWYNTTKPKDPTING